MAKITELDHHLNQEKEALDKVLSNLNELCEHNQKLQGFIEIQKKVKELKKEHIKSLSWFKKLINTVSNIKYVFVKSEEQLAKEAIEQNNKLLKHIDNTILSIADKSGPLKQELQKELRKNFNDLAKKDLSKDQRERLSNLFNNEYVANPQKFVQLPMSKPLHFPNAEELENQHNDLKVIQQNVINLLTENSNIEELKKIQKQVAEIREEVPYTFFEKLNNSWQKIKNIFVNNSEQVLAKNKENNTKTIIKIEEKLHKANNKFFELVSNKKQDIENIISKLPDSKRLEDIRENLQKHINVKDTNNITEQASAAQLQYAKTKPTPIVLSNNAISTTPPVTEEKTFTPPPMPTDNISTPPPVSKAEATEHKNIETAASNVPPPPPMPTGNVPPPPPPPVGNNIATLTPQKAKETNQPRPAVDTTNLMKQIQGGFNLKKVEYDADGKPLPKLNKTIPENKDGNKEISDLMKATLEKIKLAKASSDSERSSSDSGTDSEWASDISTRSKKVLTRKERNAKQSQQR
ncbi:MAG TPA: Arp2/3 complex-activating protein rickA [Rickettsia endosymbiont of Columbicola hoogstraali]|nr:Arp2/3 complex-activating protein rickA [Rickettsia endosymbiont of Columbicola hoogstraali]